jgi:hypothetical protein
MCRGLGAPAALARRLTRCVLAWPTAAAPKCLYMNELANSSNILVNFDAQTVWSYFNTTTTYWNALSACGNYKPQQFAVWGSRMPVMSNWTKHSAVSASQQGPRACLCPGQRAWPRPSRSCLPGAASSPMEVANCALHAARWVEQLLLSRPCAAQLENYFKSVIVGGQYWWVPPPCCREAAECFAPGGW